MSRERGSAFLGIPNYVTRPYCTITTPADTPDEMGPEWLKTEEPSDLARALSNHPSLSQFEADWADVGVTIDGMAVANTRISGSGAYRFVGVFIGLASGSIPFDSEPPDSVSLTNVTGGISNVDEDPLTPDGLVMTPSVKTLTWRATFTWTGLSNTPITGSRRAFFLLRMRDIYTSEAEYYPGMVGTLSSTGGYIRALGTRTITSASGQFIMFYFDPAEVNLSDFKLSIDVTPGQSSDTLDHYAELDAIRVYYEHETYEFDTGWITTDSLEADLLPPTQSIHYFPSSSWTIRKLFLLIQDDQIVINPELVSTTERMINALGIPRFPEGFIDAGILFAGDALVLSYGPSSEKGFGTGPETQEVSGTTEGGQSYGADAFRWRSTNAVEFFVTQEEGRILQYQLGWLRGKAGVFYIALEPDAPFKYQVMSSFPATIESMGKMIPLPRRATLPGGERLYSLDITFREKL